MFCSARQWRLAPAWLRPAGWALALVLGAGALSARASEPPLRMGYGGSWTLPWGQISGGEVVGGINRDIGLAVAQRLGVPLEFVFLTERRAHEPHLERPYDLGCGMDPKWFPDAHRFHWSAPLFEVADRLVAHRGQSAVQRVGELPRGTVVGTVRAYRYPTLQPLFADGSLKREDALDQEGALRKLSRRRTPVAVVSTQVLNWYRRQNPDHGLADWSLPVDKAGYHCAVPVGARVEAGRVLDALQALVREGEIQRILAQYAPAALPPADAP